MLYSRPMNHLFQNGNLRIISMDVYRVFCIERRSAMSAIADEIISAGDLLRYV